ncbi:MAG TPA: NAD(P)H-binding protein, partial [Thermoleophilaceae bacterium]|nr:NAD(P)H-binding protein [Thermoleophilaceae bacterium]
MRVFVAGASGAVGRPLVPKLMAAGHEVTGMTRSESRAGAVRQAGARAAVVDVFDADVLRAAVEEARPEVIVHELTALPDRIDYRKE